MIRHFVLLAATLGALSCLAGCNNPSIAIAVLDRSNGSAIPIPGAAVTLTDATAGPTQRGTSTQSGTTNGDGTVLFSRQSGTSHTASASFSDGSYAPNSVDIPANQTSATVELTPNKPHLFVVVTNSTGLSSLPQNNATVTITPSDGSAPVTRTTSASHFNGSTFNQNTDNGIAGPVTVTGGVRYDVFVVGSDKMSTARGSISFPQGGTASQVLVLDLQPAAVLTVVVSDPSKNPLSGAAVSVSLPTVQLGSPPFASGKTGADGTVMFLLPVGQTYTVTASLTGFSIASQQIQFTAAQTVALTLQPSAPPANLIVTVLNANGAPVANAIVGVFLFDPNGNEPLVNQGTTGATGVAGFVVDTTKQYQVGAALGGPPKSPAPNSPVIAFPPTPQHVTLILARTTQAPGGGSPPPPATPTTPTVPAAGAKGPQPGGKVLPPPGG